MTKKKLRQKHKKKFGEQAVGYKSFCQRLTEGGRSDTLAVETPSRGQGGSIYFAKHKGTKMKYRKIGTR